MIFQLCNYTWPHFILLCDKGIAKSNSFLINLDECGSKTQQAETVVWAWNCELTDPVLTPACDIKCLIKAGVCWFDFWK